PKQTAPDGTGRRQARGQGLRTPVRTRAGRLGPQPTTAVAPDPVARRCPVNARSLPGVGESRPRPAALSVRRPPGRRSVVVEDRAHAAAPGDQRIETAAEQVDEEGLVRLPLAVAVHDSADGLRRTGRAPGACLAVRTPPAAFRPSQVVETV